MRYVLVFAAALLAAGSGAHAFRTGGIGRAFTPVRFKPVNTQDRRGRVLVGLPQVKPHGIDSGALGNFTEVLESNHRAPCSGTDRLACEQELSGAIAQSAL